MAVRRLKARGSPAFREQSWVLLPCHCLPGAGRVTLGYTSRCSRDRRRWACAHCHPQDAEPGAWRRRSASAAPRLPCAAPLPAWGRLPQLSREPWRRPGISCGPSAVRPFLGPRCCIFGQTQEVPTPAGHLSGDTGATFEVILTKFPVYILKWKEFQNAKTKEYFPRITVPGTALPKLPGVITCQSLYTQCDPARSQVFS